MGRGSSKGGSGGSLGHGGGMKPGAVVSTQDMISARHDPTNQAAVDQVLTVAKDIVGLYGGDSAIEGNFQIAELKGADAISTLGFYDGANIAINQNFMDVAKMNGAMKDAAKSGYHPKLGGKSGMQSVAAHEYGHALTDTVAKKMGISSGDTIDKAATRIVHESKKSAGFKNSLDLAKSISGYAKTSYAEAVAEAVCDVYCNGGRAKKASRAIVDTMGKYLR